ncbi:MAG: hypothetical protein R2856_01090 [Caldilineaceae bacterium]
MQSYANEVGLTARCCRSARGQPKVRRGQRIGGPGHLDGLNSTPSIIVNGQLIENGFDYQALSAEIRRLDRTS